MPTTATKAHGALFNAAGPLDWAALLPRLGPDFAHVLNAVEGENIPEGLIEAVIVHGDSALLGALADNLRLPSHRHPNVLGRLAQTGDPQVVEAAYAEAARLHELEGSASVRTALPTDKDGIVGEIHDALDQDRLPALLTREASTPDSIRAVRRGDLNPANYPGLDWTAVVAEHTDRPFGDKAVAALVRRLIPTGARLLDEARPATTVLAGLCGHLDRSEEIRSALADHVAALGTDIAAWGILRVLLRSAEGTVAELFADVARLLAGGKGHRGDFPYGARSAFITLLDTAATDVQLALLPHLEYGTARKLLTQGTWRAEWLSFAVEAADGRYRRFLASRPYPPAGTIQALLDTGDAGLHRVLFTNPSITRAQRDQLLSKPLDPSFKAAMLRETHHWQGPDALACADPELREHILLHARHPIPHVAPLLAVWEREGRDAAFAFAASLSLSNPLHPYGRASEVFVRRLSTMDGEAAYRALRDFVANSETAEWQITELRRDHRDDVDLLMRLNGWDWQAILTAHRAEPLPTTSLRAICRKPGCPDELRQEGQAIPPPRAGPHTDDPKIDAPTEQALREKRLDDHSFRKLCTQTFMTGALTSATLIAHGHPARFAAALLTARRNHTGSALATLLQDTLGGNIDAWVLALRMLPDFEGTLPELLRTAALTASWESPR